MFSTIFTIANIITSLRIVGTAVLLFIAPFTKEFFIIYSLTGFTDAIDGTIARKTNTQSPFGAKLDSIADLLLYGVMLVKILPVLLGILPQYIWVIFWIIVIIRAVTYIYTAFKHHKFLSNHTVLNKISGFFAFMLPYFICVKSVAVLYCNIIGTIVLISTLGDLWTTFRKDS